MVLPEEFELGAVLKREDPRDAFVSSKYNSLEEMPYNAVVGTASLRRELIIRARFPHLKVKTIRGNVGTRLAKLDNGEFDALVMATAGLKRLGMTDRIKTIIPAPLSLPSPGQGAIGIEIRKGDKETAELISFLNNEETRLCTRAEREVSRALGGVPARFLWLPMQQSMETKCTYALWWAITRPENTHKGRCLRSGK